MSKWKSYDDASQGNPNLAALQWLQDNWGKTEIKASVQVEKVTITSSGTTGVAAPGIPVGAEIIDVVVQAGATSGSGTAKVRIAGGGSDISDAITMAVLDAVTRASTIDQTYKVVTSTGIEVVTNGIADAGDVYIFYKK
jgi:hypothetical protein